MRLRLPFTGRRRAGLWMRTALALGLLSSAVPAADIHLMTSGGFAAVVEELAPRYERQSGNHIIVIRGASMGATPEAIPARLKRGEEADVVILARSALDALVADGAVQKGSEVDLVRSRIGMAVKAGAPVPDISSADAFKRTLLAAKSVAYSDSASGVYISTEMLQAMGIAAQVLPKSKMIPGTPVGLEVAGGSAEIGFQQISELLPIAGIKLVGPIPEPLQKITIFSAGVAARSKAAVEARKLIEYLVSPGVWPDIRRAGLEPAAEPASK